ncbi:MAG: methyltransferase domain-containing protein [Pseudomonadota bacterium]|nr:methyltransferase domain-containing protein [Pseudomonadota bacterium]
MPAHDDRAAASGHAAYDHAASFGHHAEAYARHRPTYPAALFDWLAELAPSRRLAIDVASGAGQAALALAARFDRVVATDRSAELLATIPAHPHLTTRTQPAEALDVGEPADLVVTAQALHWFAEEPFWSRVRAALRPGGGGPGGVFAAFGYADFTISPRIDAVLAPLHAALEPHWSPRNRLLLDGYRSIAIPFEELPAPAFTIRIEWSRAELLAYLGTWSAVTALRTQGHDVLGALAPTLAAVWPDDEVRVVEMPLAVRAFHVGSAHVG